MSASSMGFWSETGRRLKGQRAARFGFRALLGLFVLGALAPLLAREAPLWASVEGTMRWPAFSAFSAADVVWLGALLIAVIGRLRRRLPRRVVGLAMVVI
ncbi:MAG: hypothetical protein CMJ83_20725, partial [Planctomycetes bacterium]|nr:hypothetical protein [Planctomycetota bacterium]